jgi:mannose/fructose/sorbose-specific phosphotransferase system IIA component
MIGIVVVGHGNLPDELLNTASLFCGNSDKVIAVSFDPNQSCEELYYNLKEAVSRLASEQGILILTDIEGGTPSNQALRLAMELGNIEAVSGINLPMLLSVLLERDSSSLMELRNQAIKMGVVSIVGLNQKVTAQMQTDAQDLVNLHF